MAPTLRLRTRRGERSRLTRPCQRSNPGRASLRNAAKSVYYDLVVSVALAIECCAPLAAPVLNEEEATATAALFSALGNPARVRIVNVLAASDEPVCLCNLIEPLGLAQATVSQHLKRLVEAGLVSREERGKWSYFSLNSEAFERVAALADLPKGACC
jgi:ArsR family transcriptional regulator, arsenate/arsenite/antimonite-responsive transcriptional repressor